MEEDAGSGSSGDSVYGGPASEVIVDAWKEILSDTDVPSLGSRVTDNAMVVD